MGNVDNLYRTKRETGTTLTSVVALLLSSETINSENAMEMNLKGFCQYCLEKKNNPKDFSLTGREVMLSLIYRNIGTVLVASSFF